MLALPFLSIDSYKVHIQPVIMLQNVGRAAALLLYAPVYYRAHLQRVTGSNDFFFNFFSLKGGVVVWS